MIRVKVNSKSKSVEDREGKSLLYVVDGGMAEDHGAQEAAQLPRALTRRRRETKSCQRVSSALLDSAE